MSLNYGWTYIENSTANAMQLASATWKLNEVHNIDPYVQDVAGDVHVGRDLLEIKRELILIDVFFKTRADIELFLKRVIALNTVGTSTVQIRVSTSSLPGAFFNFQSGINSMEMLFKMKGGIQKVANENGVVYKIDTVLLRQAGDEAE